MRRWIYTWLPRIFGCHCRADRSFHFLKNGRRHKAPICARCTGELAGILLGILRCFFGLPGWQICVVLMIPMVFDGFLQLLTAYESTNFRRFVTGFCFGWGAVGLTAWGVSAAFRLGQTAGELFWSRILSP